MPGRRFIQEGTLFDVSAGKERERKYFLLNDMLLLGRTIKAKNSLNTQYELKEEISLKNTFIRENECKYLFLLFSLLGRHLPLWICFLLSGMAALPNAFDLVNIETAKFYTAALLSAEEKNGLMAKLSEITSVFTDRNRQDSFSDDKRGGHSINLISPIHRYSPASKAQGSVELQVMFKQHRESREDYQQC